MNSLCLGEVIQHVLSRKFEADYIFELEKNCIYMVVLGLLKQTLTKVSTFVIIEVDNSMKYDNYLNSFLNVKKI